LRRAAVLALWSAVLCLPLGLSGTDRLSLRSAVLRLPLGLSGTDRLSLWSAVWCLPLGLSGTDRLSPWSAVLRLPLRSAAVARARAPRGGGRSAHADAEELRHGTRQCPNGVPINRSNATDNRSKSTNKRSKSTDNRSKKVPVTAVTITDSAFTEYPREYRSG
jgi:hypothetical protein